MSDMKRMILVFNKDGSQVISAQPYDETFESGLKAGGVKHKVLFYDIENYYYWGDYDNGGIRSLNDQPLLEELAIDELTNKRILAKYPVHKQVNIIAECLAAAGIPLTPEFAEMRDFINAKVASHNQAIQSYKDNPDVYSFFPKPPAPVEE